MGEIALLVELGRVQAERIDNVDDSLLGVVDIVAAFLSRGVCANVDVVASDGDLLAVGLVDSAVDFLEVVGVGDDLVAGDEVLRTCRCQLGRSGGGVDSGAETRLSRICCGIPCR